MSFSGHPRPSARSVSSDASLCAVHLTTTIAHPAVVTKLALHLVLVNEVALVVAVAANEPVLYLGWDSAKVNIEVGGSVRLIGNGRHWTVLEVATLTPGVRRATLEPMCAPRAASMRPAE